MTCIAYFIDINVQVPFRRKPVISSLLLPLEGCASWLWQILGCSFMLLLHQKLVFITKTHLFEYIENFTTK